MMIFDATMTPDNVVSIAFVFALIGAVLLKGRHIQLHWDGQRISKWLDFKTNVRTQLK